MPLRHTIASSALASHHSLKWLDGVLDAYAASPLALAHDGYATSGARLLGTTSLRFALHDWQRIESVAEKPTYRTPFKRKRCLIVADGFYEWKVVNRNKIPHHIRMKNSEVFAFAGLWDHWEGEDEIIESCSIIVMPANEVMKPIHERMPAIIAPAHYDWWLDARITDKQEIMQYLASAPSNQLTAYPVSTWVNSPKNNNEQCIQPTN